jgi:hypothetical protein
MRRFAAKERESAMSRSLALTLALSAGLLLTLPSRVIADHAPPEDKPTNKYRELVRALVSPNSKPTHQNTSEGFVKFPAGYDVKAQNRIEAARKALHDNFEQALPFIIDALEDDRYCMTIDWADGDAYYNYSVGQVCRNIIASQLEVYRNTISFSGPQHWHRYDYRPITKQWWRVRKGRTLVELQIEAIDWAIKTRKAESKNEVGEDRLNEIARLQKLRNEIAKAKKPAKPAGMLRMVTSDR